MIPVSMPSIGEEELKNITEAIKTNWISSKGKFIREFENKFAKYCGVKYGVATNTGTAALHLTLASLGIGKFDEVIVPNFTMISSALAVHYTGAIPIFVDAKKDTWNMNPTLIEEKITKKTKAIMVVHIYGHPCDMNAINKIAKKYKLKVIEDAAEAHGAEYKGKRCGSLGDVACFSFYANKLITTGEGGMLVTNDIDIYHKAKKLRNLSFGETNRFLHEEVGFNYRMTNMQAAIGVAQMKSINKFFKRKRAIAALYNKRLKIIEGITCPVELKGIKNSYWMYGIKIDSKKFGMVKDILQKKLFFRGIDSRDFFVPMNKQPFFNKQSKEKFPIASELAKTGLYLPSGVFLKDFEINHICDTLENIKNGK